MTEPIARMKNNVCEIYRDSGNLFRWRIQSHNGNIIADSGQGYASKQGLKIGLYSLFQTPMETEDTSNMLRGKKRRQNQTPTGN